jgi:RNA polymerase sigma-70 factor (ECF subfamily)
MHSETTQASLLVRVRDCRDDAAWSRFDGKYRELIRRYCLRRGLSAADAEDVHQMAMAKLARALPAFRYDPVRGRFRDYLYRIVRSALCNHVARPKGEDPGVDIDGAPEPQASAPAPVDELWEQEWADHHYRLALEAARASFESRSLEMFERLVAGDPIEAVAAAFGATAQGVHKVKQRVRDRLRELIDQQIRDEDERGSER